ncbi:MAG: transcription-repair coupling factor [Planctomycetota bacterium]
MTAPSAPARAIDPRELERSPTFQELVARAARERRLAAGNLWGSSQTMVAAALAASGQGPWLLIAATETEAELAVEDLAAFGLEATVLPARESYSSTGTIHADPEAIRRRLQAAQRLSGPPERRPRLVVASLLSLLQPVPSPAELEGDYLHLAVGQRLDPEDLLERLIPAGYARAPLAERPGEVSRRGDILDVYPFAADLPLRIELFADEVESLRTFDPDTQRSVEETARVALCLAADAGGIEDGQGLPATRILPPTTVFVELEPLRIEDQAEGLRIQSSAHARALIELRARRDEHRCISLQSLPAESLNFATRSVQGLAVGMREAPAALRREVEEGRRVVVLCRTEAERQRLAELLHGIPPGVEGHVASLAKGFRFPELSLVVVNHRELAGVLGARTRAPQPLRHHVRALESFFELRPGDLVVHAVHGVARFVGLQRMERAGGEEEHLHLLFAGDVAVLVPGSRIDLVQRYVGSGAAVPELDRVGGHAFRRRQEKVERAIIDLAAELLEVQAKRELNARPPWRPDAELVDLLVASFPFPDTGDQKIADAEIAADLAGARPMDRLLCGDVGFGKTELAVRAAFRAVTAGAQVAVLVPTTVLAHQHDEVFRGRLADFPVEVASLSRYVTGKAEEEIVARVARGEIDILIGTHRILSDDVSFANLGLVIVDEEQRFGVRHKEHFKQYRAQVDVLSLSATPIPRTLHMSLSGLRDISALTEPPEGRQEIDTQIVWAQDVSVVREAIRREKNRGGQVFFLHNRVESIARKARELAILVPECSFAVGHGQMSGRQLDRVMRAFTAGDVDVLVATTIVENGIDIPTAGTILIDDADCFGLSELHQLRGRVGRGRHKAYCFLIVDRTKPMRDVARERLKAIEELTQLGAGFQISMKDLEIRGAGNILGPEQSGHIAAVGYDMYCRLLRRTVERMQADPSLRAELLEAVPAAVTAEIEAAAVEMELGVRAFLPAAWIPAAATRLEILRRLGTIETEADAAEALAMLRDRYGRVPAEAAALVRQFLLRARLAQLGIRRLSWRGETYLVEYADRVALERLLAPAKVEVRPLRAGTAHVVIPPDRREAAAAWAWIEALLRPAPEVGRMAETARPRSAAPPR